MTKSSKDIVLFKQKVCLWYKKCVQAKDRALFQLLSLSCQSVTSLSARCAVTVQVVIFELNSLLTSSSTPHSLVFLSFRQMAEVSHCWNRESTCTRPLSSQRTSTSCFRRSHCPVRALRAVTPCSPMMRLCCHSADWSILVVWTCRLDHCPPVLQLGRILHVMHVVGPDCFAKTPSGERKNVSPPPSCQFERLSTGKS